MAELILKDMYTKKLKGFLGLFLVLIAGLWLAAPIARANGLLQLNLTPLTQKKLNYQLDNVTGAVRSLQVATQPLVLTKRVSGAKAVGQQFLNEYAAFFGAEKNGKNLAQFSVQADNQGITHIRYQQQVNGVPVYGAGLLVHLKGNNVQTAAGHLLPNLTINTKTRLSAAKSKTQAIILAKNIFNNASLTVIGAPQLYVFNKLAISQANEDKNYLVYQVNVFNAAAQQLKTLFINAADGSLVYQLDASPTDGTLNRRVYDCNNVSGTCYLSGAPSGSNNGRAEGQAVSNDGQIDSLYSAIGSFHSYIKDAFGLNGTNNAGGTGGGGTYPKKFTDGYANFNFSAASGYTCPNSLWNGVDGALFCLNTVNLPIVGHEYGHSIVQYQGPATLPYEGESGAINEAYADIFGQGLLNYGNIPPTWQIGPAGDAPWRDMATPANTNNPDSFYSNKFYCGNADNKGVHQNSTVISHAAYLMTIGGTVDSCTVGAIGFDKVQQIFYLALSRYLPNNATFNNLFDAVNSACNELYGVNGDTCWNVTKAMRAVRLDQGGACSGVAETAPDCSVVDLTRQNVRPDVQINLPNQPIIVNDTNTSTDNQQPDQDDKSDTDNNDIKQDWQPVPDQKIPDQKIPDQKLPDKKVFDNKSVLPFGLSSPQVKILVTQKKNEVIVEGYIVSYGTTQKCTDPRPDISGAAVIIRPCDGKVDEPAVKGNEFYGDYFCGPAKGKGPIDLSVSVYNSCYQSSNQHFNISTDYSGAGDSVQGDSSVPAVKGMKIQKKSWLENVLQSLLGL